MRYFFELSKEHITLPKAEVIACLHTEKINFNIVKTNEDVLIVETDVKEEIIKKIADRLSFTFFVDEFLFECSHDEFEIKKNAIQNQIKQLGSVAIKYKNRTTKADSQKIVKTLADVYTKNRDVTLNNPDIEIRALITRSTVYVGRKIFEIDRSIFEKRKVQHRPFFSPISLHPKLARALVNLSEINKDETMLDPFCGTGGILLEAGLIGVNVIGSDIEKKMIEGSKETLDFYKIKKFEIFLSDIGKIGKYIKKVDSVVTDLPYGKSTTTKGEEIKKLYTRAFKQISKVLKKDGIAVIGISKKDLISIGKKFFELKEIHELKVHRSLTRCFAVFIKRP